jgi:hemerythrin-like domain-containing protein
MSWKNGKTRRLSRLLEEEEAETLEKTGRLEQVLTHLRYEGRASLGKNFKETERLLQFFDHDLVRHIRLEEEVVFPYLAAHIPKLDLLISLLRSEHREFQRNLRRFKFWLTALRRKRKASDLGKVIEQIRETGTYLVYLLQSHVQDEGRVFYDVASRELSPGEKRELARRLIQGGKPA